MSPNPFKHLGVRIATGQLFLWVGGACLVYGVQKLMLMWTQWSIPTIAPLYFLLAALVTAGLISAIQWVRLSNQTKRQRASSTNPIDVVDNFKRYVLSYSLVGAFLGACAGLAYGFISYLVNTHLLAIQLDPSAYIMHGIMVAAVLGVAAGLLYGAFVNSRLKSDVQLAKALQSVGFDSSKTATHFKQVLASYLLEFPVIVKTLMVTVGATVLITAGYLMMPAALPPYHGLLLPGLPLGLQHVHPLLSALIWGVAVGMLFLLAQALFSRSQQGDLQPLKSMHIHQAKYVRLQSELRALRALLLDCGVGIALGALSLTLAIYFYSTLSLQVPWLSVPLSHLAYAAAIGGMVGLTMMFVKTLLQPNARQELIKIIRKTIQQSPEDGRALLEAKAIALVGTYGMHAVTAVALNPAKGPVAFATPLGDHDGGAAVVAVDGGSSTPDLADKTVRGDAGVDEEEPDAAASAEGP